MSPSYTVTKHDKTVFLLPPILKSQAQLPWSTSAQVAEKKLKRALPGQVAFTSLVKLAAGGPWAEGMIGARKNVCTMR